MKLAFRGASATLVSAMNAAASDWSSVGQSNLRVSTANGGPIITVNVVDGSSWPSGTPCDPGTLGCSEAPLNGRPGANIYLPSHPAKGTGNVCGTWSASMLARVTRHELGHAVGFAHPKESGSTLIVSDAGTPTASCPNAATSCLTKPTYDTVMSHFSVDTTCATNVTTLSFDDRVACSIVYESGAPHVASAGNA